MRFFVALCLAWFAALTPARPDSGELRGPSSLRAVESAHISPILRATGPQLASLADATAPVHASVAARTARAPLSGADPTAALDARTARATSALARAVRLGAQQFRDAAHGAVAPHFATAPPLQS